VPLLRVPLLRVPLLRVPLLRVPLLRVPLLRVPLLRVPLLRGRVRLRWVAWVRALGLPGIVGHGWSAGVRGGRDVVGDAAAAEHRGFLGTPGHANPRTVRSSVPPPRSGAQQAWRRASGSPTTTSTQGGAGVAMLLVR
jgi:hypothetical protein